MEAEPSTQEQEPTAEPAADQRESFNRWQRIGRHALRVVRRPVLKPLREVLAECEALVVYEHWLANGQNVTRTAEALGISRRRARASLKPWRHADVSGEERED